MISVIIPIYNEAEILNINLQRFANLSYDADLIFVDGGSNDGSIEIAEKYGRVVRSKKNRAVQMNRGAKKAQNDILLFLHADNFIYPETLKNIERETRQKDILGGCLTQRIDKKGIIFRLIEAQGNARARISKVFYGDQGVFVRKSVFFQLAGFPEVPIMEDVLFTKKLRKIGKTTVLPDKIFVSPRRWEHDGILRTTLRYNLINLAFKAGISLEKIKLLYEKVR